MNPNAGIRNRIETPLLALPAMLAASVLAFLLLVPSAHGRATAVEWTPPTKADRSGFRVPLGKSVALTLTAQASGPVERLSIEPVGGLPRGATISTDSQDGEARAVFRWKPSASGEFMIQFVAATGARVSTPVRTYVITVFRPVSYPQRYRLTDTKTGHWATVLRPAAVRSEPRASARVVAKLPTMTPEHTQNVVLVLEGIDHGEHETWYRVRLPVLPNNSTGWVPRRFLGEPKKIDTRLLIDRKSFTATLKRDGVTVFRARIGVGERHWPTPPGEFYIRSRLNNFGSAIYGPLAFGTSARSAVLTDWPGGGFVGIHGTNEPELLPGRVSHGCIRLRNRDILRLASLMKVGTPVTIR